MFQSLKQAVSDFESNEMNDFRKQVQNILKTCNENSKNELQEISQGKIFFDGNVFKFEVTLRYFVELAIDKQLEELLANLSAMLSQLEDATRQRKQLEGIIEFCQHWFKQADINLAVEIRNSTTPEILVEHIMVVREKISVLFIIFINFVIRSL